MYLYDKYTFMTIIPLWQMYLYDKCTLMTNILITNVIMTCVPFMRIVPLWQMYDKCTFVLMISVFKWQIIINLSWTNKNLHCLQRSFVNDKETDWYTSFSFDIRISNYMYIYLFILPSINIHSSIWISYHHFIKIKFIMEPIKSYNGCI